MSCPDNAHTFVGDCCRDCGHPIPPDRNRLLTLELTLGEITIIACAIGHHRDKGFAVKLCQSIMDKIVQVCK